LATGAKDKMSATGLSDYLNQVGTAMRGGDHANALALADRAVTEGHEHPALLTLAAHGHLAAAPDKARGLAARACELAPASTEAFHTLALALMALERPRDAIIAFEEALKGAPGLAALHFGKAQAHERLEEFAAVRRELEAAIAADPTHADALAWLATLAVQRNDPAAARGFAARALAQRPGQPEALLAQAQADIAENKHDDAVRGLKTLLAGPALAPINRALAQGLMGDALDGLDRTGEAFAAYTEAKATLRAQYATQFAVPGAMQGVATLAAYFRAADPSAWRARKSEAVNGRTHVFLLGFPRSGTTLLEQVLASHPDIETMEEQNAFNAVIDGLAGDDTNDRLAALSEAELERYRKAYWDVVASRGIKATAPVFVDKMPLNTLLMPLIARLFPDAKILFALRDPRDVVLSCFRRRFGMTPQMYQLTTLEGTAAYYDAVMALAAIYRDKLDLALIETRHESLLADFEGETRRVCDFLGVPWRDAMKDFARRAQDNAINTPSAPQVARGLTSEGMGQWKRYAKELAPVLPRLEPWVARFGYGETP
jgi:tetratricopeptide (TPR) repeat protein